MIGAGRVAPENVRHILGDGQMLLKYLQNALGVDYVRSHEIDELQIQIDELKHGVCVWSNLKEMASNHHDNIEDIVSGDIRSNREGESIIIIFV